MQRADGLKASETDLRPAQQPEIPKTSTHGDVDIMPDGKTLENVSGSSVKTTFDGQSTVSQLVSWEAKFVTKISEITDSLDISGG